MHKTNVFPFLLFRSLQVYLLVKEHLNKHRGLSETFWRVAFQGKRGGGKNTCISKVARGSDFQCLLAQVSTVQGFLQSGEWSLAKQGELSIFWGLILVAGGTLDGLPSFSGLDVMKWQLWFTSTIAAFQEVCMFVWTIPACKISTQKFLSERLLATRGQKGHAQPCL